MRLHFVQTCAIGPSCHTRSKAFMKVAEGEGEVILFNVGGQTGKDCLLTWADGSTKRRQLECAHCSLRSAIREIESMAASLGNDAMVG